MIIDPLVKLAFQSIRLLSVLTIFRQFNDLFGIALKIVELFPPIGIEIVFPLGRSNGSDRVYPGLLAVVLGDDVVAARLASLAGEDRGYGLAVASDCLRSGELEKRGCGVDVDPMVVGLSMLGLVGQANRHGNSQHVFIHERPFEDEAVECIHITMI